MYSIELTIKLSPLPLIVQRKDQRDAQRLYAEVLDSMKKGNQRFIELTCEKVEDKKIKSLDDNNQKKCIAIKETYDWDLYTCND